MSTYNKLHRPTHKRENLKFENHKSCIYKIYILIMTWYVNIGADETHTDIDQEGIADVCLIIKY